MNAAPAYRGNMAEVEALCGREVADAVSEALAGLNLYVPMSELAPDGSSPLDKVEERHVGKLMEHFGGSTIYVSRPRIRRPTSEQIAQARANGLTAQEIALRHQISERWVLRVLSRRAASASGAPGPDTKSNAGLTHPTGAGGPRQSPTTPKPKTPASGPLRASQRHES